jgi:AcrR family transcriptional regulator
MGRPRSGIQERIVAAARTRFRAHGVDGASLREIARDADTNIGMVVYYFPTKDDLFLAVVEEVYAGVVRDMAAILDTEGSARERLRGAFVRLGRASELELEVIQLVLRESLSSSARFRRILARFMRGHVPLIMATITDGVRRGELDSTIPVPFILIAAIGLGALPQIARRVLSGAPPFAGLPGVEDLADLSTRLLFGAAGPAGQHRSRPSPSRRTRSTKGNAPQRP